MMKTSTTRKKTMVISQAKTAHKKDEVDQKSSRPAGLVTGASHRKASTPTQEKPVRTESPDVSRIMPTNITSVNSGESIASRKPSKPPSSTRTATISNEEISLKDQIDFEYTRYLQTMFKRKLAEAKASEVDNELTVLQKRIAENQNILQKTTERLKNIKFNKEVETLDKLRNRNYGQILDNLGNANCKEYLETVTRKLEQRENQLRMKNIELPEGGSAELLDVIKVTLAACEKCKANNNVEDLKDIAEIKASNNSTSETLSRCLERVPEVENLILDKSMLEMSAKYK